MAKGPLSLIESTDEAMHPFHRASLGVIFCGTLSLQAVMASYFEPVISVWLSLLLTFPLTTGLTIVFLIFISINWRRLTLAWIVIAPSLIAILFFLLSGLARVLDLPEKTARFERHERTEARIRWQVDSTEDPVRYQIAAQKNKQQEDKEAHERFEKMRAERAARDSMLSGPIRLGSLQQPPEETRWYERGPFSRTITGGYWVFDQFRGFYRLYGPVRFWTGVMLAVFFASYIRHYARKLNSKMEAREK